MLLKCFNRALIDDRERTYLTSAGTAGDTSLTVSSTDLAPDAASSNTWADNDYMIVGEIGTENAEVMQMNAAVTSATSLTIDREGQAGGLRHNHSIDEPVYRIDFNRVEFSRATTDDTGSVSVLTTIPLQADDEFTRHDDTTNTTGFGFARFNNQTTAAFSSYSDGVNYDESGTSGSRDPRTLFSMRRKVRKLLDEESSRKLDDKTIDDAINDRQRDVAHQRLWSFYEIERSLSGVADQFAYDVPTTVSKVHTARYDTQPLAPINQSRWEQLHWDSDTSAQDPSHIHIWNNQVLLWPRPSSSAQTTTLNGALTAAATTITVTSTSGFNRGDYYRFIINSEVIYATASTSTTFTGALRGREGTTAAAHSDTDTVTERDIVYSGHVEPTDLIDSQARTSIPEPDVLVYGTAADLALFLEKETLHDRLLAKYETAIKDLEEKYVSKYTAQFGRVKDMTELVSDYSFQADPNKFPRSINA